MKYAIAAFLMIWAMGCAFLAPKKGVSVQTVESQMVQGPIGSWFFPAQGAEKAVIIVVHGLNLKPNRMDDWVHLFTKAQAAVFRVSLTGHHGDTRQMRTVTQAGWRNDMAQAAQEAFGRAESLGVPVYFLGFSLGALLGLDWMKDGAKEPAFQKMALLSPAIALPWYAKGVHLAAPLGPNTLLPGKTPKDYRANSGSSLAAYWALFRTRDELAKSSWDKLNVPTLVLMDQYDEVISFSGVRQLIVDKKLSRWRLSSFDNRHANETFGLRHLVIDENAVGPEVWQELSQQVLKHFFSP